MVKEFIASVAFSRGNIVAGAINTGASKDCSGNGLSFETVLKNCPVIAEWSAGDDEKMTILVAKCREIAMEMAETRVNKSVDYLGTPDDQRMVLAFGESFGDIHISTGSVTSGHRVTELEFIRWRTTLYGADGQIEIDAKKRVAVESNKFSSNGGCQ